jgi:hypothetical protein
MRATIIPTVPTLEKYSPLNGGYHLILASIAKAYPAYTAFYRSLTDKGEFVILDNDAYEEGTGASFETLKALNEAILPAEIVLPDVLTSGSETFKKSRATLEAFRDEPSKNYPKFMGVPHGGTVHEWLGCAQELVSLGVDSLGMARMYGEDPDGGLVKYLQALNGWLARYKWERSPIPVHLLGWSNRLEALSEVANAPYMEGIYLRGVDSSKPLTYAFHSTYIEENVSYLGRPKGYFALGPERFDDQTVKFNFRYFRQFANGLR